MGFPGNRMPVQTVFENLEAGMSVDEITEVFDVTPGGSKKRYCTRQPESRESARVRLMKILFDNGTPKPIARSLAGHEITYAPANSPMDVLLPGPRRLPRGRASVSNAIPVPIGWP